VENKENIAKRKHNVTLENRRHALISGTEKVIDACPTVINLITSQGGLTVKGTELKIVSYSEADGNLTFTGEVSSLTYSGDKKPLLRRIFR